MKDELLLKYGGGGASVLHPIALGITILMVILVLKMPRRLGYIPVIVAALFIPLEQRVVVSGLDFMLYRIVLLSGLVRVLRKPNEKLPHLNLLDRLFALWVASAVISYTVLFGTIGAFINRLGFGFDAMLTYFLLRVIVKDHDDVVGILTALVICSSILACFILVEKGTGRNFFSVFGGVPSITGVREGVRRCQGAFAHSLMAGSFGATSIPLAVSLWWVGRQYRKISLAGCMGGTIIAVSAGGSGPLAAYAAGVVGLAMWKFRRHLKIVLIGLVSGIILLHVVMKAPVWALIARAKIFGGSTGYHRYVLIENFFRRFDEWWLVGTRLTGGWGFGMWDVTNMYIRVGVDGGLTTLLLFLGIICVAFKMIARYQARTEGNVGRQRFLWALGSSLLSHSVAFFGVSYFDQMRYVWYILIAIISVETSGGEMQTMSARDS